MPSSEIFPNPLVKQVHFEVRFQNLFFVEARIGDFQVRVMKYFPQSELVHRRSLMLLAGTDDSIQDLAKKQQSSDSVDKVWQFKSLSGTTLAITNKSLGIISEQHKSYNQGGDNSFRTIIKMVVDHFVEVVKIQTVLRIGLRYVNEGPIFDRSAERFINCYNSILPLNRFGLENAVGMDCVVLVNTENCQLRHLESLKMNGDRGQLVIDLDASVENVPSEELLGRTDHLHEKISKEFRETIKEPIVEFMRRPKGEN